MINIVFSIGRNTNKGPPRTSRSLPSSDPSSSEYNGWKMASSASSSKLEYVVKPKVEGAMSDKEYEAGHEGLLAYLKADGGRSIKDHILAKLDAGMALNPMERAMAERVYMSMDEPMERMRMGLSMPYVIIVCPKCHYQTSM